MTRGNRLYDCKRKEFQAKEITDSEMERAYLRNSQRPLWLERNEEWLE